MQIHVCSNLVFVNRYTRGSTEKKHMKYSWWNHNFWSAFDSHIWWAHEYHLSYGDGVEVWQLTNIKYVSLQRES